MRMFRHYSFLSCLYGSPDELDGKLNLPRCSRGRGEYARARDQSQILAEHLRAGGSRGTEIRPVQYVEDLGAKLHVHVLRQPVKSIVLEKGGIQVEETLPGR